MPFDPVSFALGASSAKGRGSSTLSGLTDVDLTNPTNGQTLVYDAASSKWVNGNGGGGGFTLLHGTYSLTQDGTEIVTLSVTASELFALMQSSTVFFDYVNTAGDETYTYLIPVLTAMHLEETGFDDTYTFTSLENNTDPLVANDAVVFVVGGK